MPMGANCCAGKISLCNEVLFAWSLGTTAHLISSLLLRLLLHEHPLKKMQLLALSNYHFSQYVSINKSSFFILRAMTEQLSIFLIQVFTMTADSILFNSSILTSSFKCSLLNLAYFMVILMSA